MNFFAPIIEIMKLLFDALSHQINHARKFKKNLTELEGKRDTLISLEEDVSKEIARAELLRKEPKNEVQNWLKKVAKVKEEISDIEKECEEKKMWFKNCMPNYWLRQKVSKKSLELTGKLENIIKECSFDSIVVDLLPATMRTFATTLLFGEEVIEIYMKQIWEWLIDENIGKIGVQGMGGVGKTTIATHINNRLKDVNIFDSIIWVTVSKELSLKRLQSDIANAIEEPLPDELDEKNRCGRLFEALSRRKKFVLILDDLWEVFSLDDIGILEPNKENGAKMVLTTRSLLVCDGMQTQKNIKLNVLPKDYAWDLFRSKVDEDVLTKSGIENVAKLVAKECKGLPLALITVGQALRNANDVRLWRNALNELKGSTHNIRGMKDDVFKRLKFSYTRLRDENVRECFLYWSLYPEDYKINVEELINFWIWEGLINEGDKEVEKDKGYSIVNELICACMLEMVSKNDVREVMMHDLIRDMAIGITRDRPRFMVKTGIGLKEHPKEEEFAEDIERISLSWNDIASLTGHPNCPKLMTLFLHWNSNLSSISSSFFLYMYSLRVLVLSWTRIEALLESLSILVNLRVLLLDHCTRLVVLPSLAKLKELRILDLNSTAIRELPPGMEGLVNLKYLDLSYTQSLETIRDGIITHLSVLEKLALKESLLKCDMTNREGEILIKEILGLKRLDILAIDFKDLQSFLVYHKSDHWQSLCNYQFSIGHIKARKEDIFYHNGRVRMMIDDSNLLRFTNSYLIFKQCRGTLVIPLVLLDSRVLNISNCHCSECIFKGEENLLLSTIETLNVTNMSNLKNLSKGVMTCGALANLKILSIYFCNSLTTLFSFDPSQSLHNIEEIKIYYCSSMEQMVVEEVDGEDKCEVKNITRNSISLPRLRVLEFWGVKNLKYLSKRTLICISLQYFELDYCPKLINLLLSIENPMATLEGCIKGSRDWWNALDWEDPNTKTILQPLF